MDNPFEKLFLEICNSLRIPQFCDWLNKILFKK